MKIVVIILVIVLIIMALLWFASIIYWMTKGLLFKFFFHNVLGWHIPKDNEEAFDGCSFHSHCKICKKEIMQDSQGNWF